MQAGPVDDGTLHPLTEAPRPPVGAGPAGDGTLHALPEEPRSPVGAGPAGDRTLHRTPSEPRPFVGAGPAGDGIPHRPRRQAGFTLLEVLVALTITAMALGGLFSVIGGNKQLAWRSQEALLRTTQARNLIGYAQLNDTRGDLIVDFEARELDVSDLGELPPPVRKTQAMRFALREYEILDADGEPLATGSYWTELDLPR